MKKILVLVLAFVASQAWAVENSGVPSIESRMAAGTSTSAVTIAAPGTGLRNCVTDFTVVSASTYTFRMLDGNTTSYVVLMPAAGVLSKSFGIHNPWCVSSNNPLKLTVDNGSYTINYLGVIIRK